MHSFLRKSLLCVAPVLLFFAGVSSAQTTVMQGKVVGEDGNLRYERHEYLVYPYTLVDTGRVSLGRVAA